MLGGSGDAVRAWEAGVGGCGGGYEGVVGRGEVVGGSEDDLLGGEVCRGGRGGCGKLLSGGRHRSELVSSCLSSSSSQRRFLVLLASGGAISGEGDETASIGDGVGAGEGPGGCVGEL
jgi:hypothetical protein